jgi:glucokinase
MRAFVGVDVGGTKISSILWSDGEILYRGVVPSAARTTSDFEETVLQAVNDMGEHAEAVGCTLVGIGIGCAGLVDQQKGRYLFPTNIPGVHEVALAEYLRGKIGLPVFLENDANCALLAEWIDGVARGYRNVILVTVGTGVGGGLIVDNHLYVGRHGFAGEIGHISMVQGGLPCGCGRHGCLETIASGTGIQRYVQQALRRGAKSSMCLADASSARIIAEFALRGDQLARRAFQRAARYLGRTIASLINTMDPEMVVIGGGVPESGLIVDELVRTAEQRSMPLLFEGVQIVTARYKNDAGAVGAALLAQRLVDNKPVYST